MAENQSPFLLVKTVETQLVSVLSALDVYALPMAQQKVVAQLRRDIVDLRLDTRDYELSETREEQLRKAHEAGARLTMVRSGILKASEYDIFGAVDVALLSAKLERVQEFII